MKNKDRILVVDINYLPSEFKDRTVKQVRKELEKYYKEKVFLIDTSRQNINGEANRNQPATYFVQ